MFDVLDTQTDSLSAEYQNWLTWMRVTHLDEITKIADE